jgi:hypothetical protein
MGPRHGKLKRARFNESKAWSQPPHPKPRVHMGLTEYFQELF